MQEQKRHNAAIDSVPEMWPVNRIILEIMKVELNKMLQDEQAGFRKEWSWTDHIVILIIILGQMLQGIFLFTRLLRIMRKPLTASTVQCCGSCQVTMAAHPSEIHRDPHQYVQKTYKKYTCRVNHNGVPLEMYEMLNGVCQGCFLSVFSVPASHQLDRCGRQRRNIKMAYSGLSRPGWKVWTLLTTLCSSQITASQK